MSFFSLTLIQFVVDVVLLLFPNLLVLKCGRYFRSLLNPNLTWFCTIIDGAQRLLWLRGPTQHGQQEQVAHPTRCSNSIPTILPVFGCTFQVICHLLCANACLQRPIHCPRSFSLVHWLDLLSPYLCQNRSRFHQIICTGRCPEYLFLMLKHVLSGKAGWCRRRGYVLLVTWHLDHLFFIIVSKVVSRH